MTVAPAAASSVPTGAGAVLQMTAVSKRYGGVRALRDGHLTIARPGEAHALVGANGSGKSTLLGVLSGQIRPDGGSITMSGEQVALHSAHAALARGIVMVSQETAVAPDLTVAENVLLGHRQARKWTGISARATRLKAENVLHRLGLDLDPLARVGELPPDQQQLVEIARALSTDARLVILDEPTSSLTDDQVRTLSNAVRRLSSQQVSVLLVSHRFDEIFDLCSRVTVLRDGVTVLERDLDHVTPDSLVGAMLGGMVDPPGPASPAEVDQDGEARPPLLSLRGLTAQRSFADVDLDVMPGEIVGLAGLVGSGRSELLASIFGVQRSDAGTVLIDDQAVPSRSPRAMIARGVGLLPPDRKVQGLVLKQSLTKNLVMVSGLRRWRVSVPRRRAEAEIAHSLATRMRLKSGGLDSAAETLSGGNQQKVALGKWLAADVRLLLLDEPTRGVDVAAKTEIHALLKQFAARGMGILVSSSETDELLGLCDRILVMSRGRITTELAAGAASDGRIAAAMGGHA